MVLLLLYSISIISQVSSEGYNQIKKLKLCLYEILQRLELLTSYILGRDAGVVSPSEGTPEALVVDGCFLDNE